MADSDQRGATALTAHTSNEVLASEIFAQIPTYRRLLRAWLERLAKA